MGKRVLSTAFVVVAWPLVGLAATVQSPTAADTKTTNARIAALVRLSPGGVSPEAVDALRAGLGADLSPIRATAARVAHAIGAVASLPDLVAALEKESDPEAAYEQAWAIADLDSTAGSDPALLRAFERPELQRAVLEAMVSGRGARIAPLWSALQSGLKAHPGTVVAALVEGLHQEVGTMFASSALRDGMDGLFAALLSSASVPVDSSLAMAGLSTSSSTMRTAAYRFLAGHGASAPGEEGVERPGPENLGERIARHLFEAALGRSRTETFRELLAAVSSDKEVQSDLQARYARSPRPFRGLSDDERLRLLKAVGVKDEDARRKPADLSKLTDPKGEVTRMKTLGGHPYGLVGAVLEATDCSGKERSFDGVEAWYRPGGRLTRIEALGNRDSPPGCAEAAKLLGLTALSSNGDRHALAILPERPEFLACLAKERGSWPTEAPAPVRAGREVKEPTKKRNVSPIYPSSSRDRRIQGVVIVEARISSFGCVSSMRVLKGVEGPLDLAAMDAVSGWAYTPTIVNGAPVPVVMTVTVNFQLR